MLKDVWNNDSTLEQFSEYLASEQLCIDFLFQVKWPSGFVCPRCEHSSSYVTETRRLPLYECRQCRHQTSLTSGTIMEGSRTSLRKWLIALFLVSRSHGVNAVELSKIIHVTYKTAWLILHKIRQTISHFDRTSLLSGIVRANSSIYGKPHNPSAHKHPREHYFLIGSSINHQEAPQQVKLKLIPEQRLKQGLILKSENVHFSENHVAPQTSDFQIVTGRYSPHRFHSLLKIAKQACSWINEAYHGIGKKHLQFYLDEFSYRFNHSAVGTSIFPHLMQLSLNPASASRRRQTC